MSDASAPTPSPSPSTRPTVAARPAATTLILRDSGAGLQVLMVRRSMQASFMPGAYVFPGGAVDAADGSMAHLAALDEPVDRLVQRIGAVTGLDTQAPAFAVAALRECFEECGLWLGAPDHHADAATWTTLRARLHAGATLAELAPEAGGPLATSQLHPWSRWVTPVGLPKRFDTLFVVTRAPVGQVPEVDAGETTTLAWVHPAQALADRKAGSFQMEFATVATVQSLAPFDTVAALLAHAAAQTSLQAIHPRLVIDASDRVAGVLLPGQAGYDSAFSG